MINNKAILAIIPARGGSKGLPKKNIKLLNGKPMIAYTIEEAKKSKYINKLILSTDCPEIVEVASRYNVENPFMRPKYLATDTASAIDNYEYTLKRLEEEFNYKPDILVILQPTSPLRTTEDIDCAIEIFIQNKADSVISLCETTHPINWIRRISPDGKIKNYLKENINHKNRQEMKTLYIPNGALLILNPRKFFKKRVYYFEDTYPYIMSKEKSIDIDTQIDFELAEIILKKRMNNY